jgi:hypothetical protein
MYSVNFTIIDGDINLYKLIEELANTPEIPDPAEIAFSNSGTLLQIYFVDPLSSEEETALNTLIAEHDPETLASYKKAKVEEIDKRTAELINEGFEFCGIQFSASLQSQTRILASFTSKDIMPYPVTWMSKDDTTALEITDATMMANFYINGLLTLKSKIDQGSILKLQVAAATSIEEIDLIADSR